ncbi:unnamed protein product [Polarella glacialis]|uniref:Uncharacterized protein n=1 Tax=Polarella glacialis TaxID=89957 RepID=A0A813FNQ2_POLGL|nr:unnamed protein product [Polarella glacialis]
MEGFGSDGCGEVCWRECVSGSGLEASSVCWCHVWFSLWSTADSGWRTARQCFRCRFEEGPPASAAFFGRCWWPRYARGRAGRLESFGLRGAGEDPSRRASYKEQASSPTYDRGIVRGGSSGRGGGPRGDFWSRYGHCLGEVDGGPRCHARPELEELTGGDTRWRFSFGNWRLWWGRRRWSVFWEEELATLAPQSSTGATGVFQQVHGEGSAGLCPRFCGSFYFNSRDCPWRPNSSENLLADEGEDCRASPDPVLVLAGCWGVGGFDAWEAGGVQGTSPAPSCLWGTALPRWRFYAACSRAPYCSFRAQEGAGSLAQPWSALLNPTWASIHLQHLQETESWIEKRKKLAGGAKPKAGGSEDGAPLASRRLAMQRWLLSVPTKLLEPWVVCW